MTCLDGILTMIPVCAVVALISYHLGWKARGRVKAPGYTTQDILKAKLDGAHAANRAAKAAKPFFHK